MNEFAINQEFVIRGINFSEQEDKDQLAKQLEKAPLLEERTNVDAIYKKRTKTFDIFTDGYTVLEAKARATNEFMLKFDKAVHDAIYLKYLRSSNIGEDLRNANYNKEQEIFRNAAALEDAVRFNKINICICAKYGIKSPKYSKALIQTFGEQSEVVKMFNDRPSITVLDKQYDREIAGKKLVVSTLASNVMKMTAGNKFNSCQDYLYRDDDTLGHLACLPSSVHDENLAIAYICDDDNDVIFPRMDERILLASFTHEGHPFLFAFNRYHIGDETYIESSLRAIYGKNIIFAYQAYSGSNEESPDSQELITFTRKYDYSIRIPITSRYDTKLQCYPYLNHGNIRYRDDAQRITLNRVHMEVLLSDNEYIHELEEAEA